MLSSLKMKTNLIFKAFLRFILFFSTSLTLCLSLSYTHTHIYTCAHTHIHCHSLFLHEGLLTIITLIKIFQMYRSHNYTFYTFLPEFLLISEADSQKLLLSETCSDFPSQNRLFFLLWSFSTLYPPS